MLHCANIQSTALSPVWQSAAEPFVTGNNRLLGTWSKVKKSIESEAKQSGCGQNKELKGIKTVHRAEALILQTGISSVVNIKYVLMQR